MSAPSTSQPAAWITCQNCQGEEGEKVGGQWIDCACCQGEGGHPHGELDWSCTCKPEEVL